MVWFVAIAAAGLWHIGQNPTRAVRLQSAATASNFLLHHGIIGLFTLGAVFLAVTGAEALYADLGHFGRGPIRFAWLVVVLPALRSIISGRARWCWPTRRRSRIRSSCCIPTGRCCRWCVLATAATVIASQAVITGAYSLTRQAIQLGLLPRLEIRHTSEALFGQIYMPRVNTLLLIGVLLLVALFRSSSALASAYGIAVTGTMVVTAMMAFVVIWRVWRWPSGGALALMRAVPVHRSDLPLRQPAQGGRGRLGAARARRRCVMVVMYTWRRGSRLLFEKTRRQEMPLESLVDEPGEEAAARVSRARRCSSPAIRQVAPTALLHSLKHYKVLHEKNVILTIETADTPRVDPARTRAHRAGRRDVLARACCASASWRRRTCRRRWRSRASSAGSSTSCRRRSSCRAASLKPAAQSGMPRWQDRLFIGLARVANDATDYFQIPTGRVVEVGTQVTI